MVGSLSGGERGRLHLAKTLLQGGNVLLLDEPSNDLDIETLRALEDALLEFPGNAFVISHDRWFLDRIATHILAFEGDSHVEFFQGNYREYEEDKKRRLGDEGAKPAIPRCMPLGTPPTTSITPGITATPSSSSRRWKARFASIGSIMETNTEPIAIQVAATEALESLIEA
jgi:ABC-type multidrug transport system ATPase subunit